MSDHIAHVWPDQSHPIRAWITCDGVEVATRKIDPDKEGPEVLEEFFTKAIDDHMAQAHGQEAGESD